MRSSVPSARGTKPRRRPGESSVEPADIVYWSAFIRTVKARRPPARPVSCTTGARWEAPERMACFPARPAIDSPGAPTTSLPRTRAFCPVRVRRRCTFSWATAPSASVSRSPPRTARTTWRSAFTKAAPLPLVKNWETREASRPSILAIWRLV